jgi:hypothetical protein
MLKKSVSRAECRCEFDFWQDGSVRTGTYHSGVEAFRIDSPSPTRRLPTSSPGQAQLLRGGARGKTVLLESTYEVNGRSFDVDLSD